MRLYLQLAPLERWSHSCTFGLMVSGAEPLAFIAAEIEANVVEDNSGNCEKQQKTDVLFLFASLPATTAVSSTTTKSTTTTAIAATTSTA